MIRSLELSIVATRNLETSDTTKTSIFQQRFSQCTDIQLYSTISVCTPRQISAKKMRGPKHDKTGVFFNGRKYDRTGQRALQFGWSTWTRTLDLGKNCFLGNNLRCCTAVACEWWPRFRLLEPVPFGQPSCLNCCPIVPPTPPSQDCILLSLSWYSQDLAQSGLPQPTMQASVFLSCKWTMQDRWQFGILCFQHFSCSSCGACQFIPASLSIYSTENFIIFVWNTWITYKCEGGYSASEQFSVKLPTGSWSSGYSARFKNQFPPNNALCQSCRALRITGIITNCMRHVQKKTEMLNF